MSDAQAMKVALITGANKGIGLETARQLGKLGVTDRTQAATAAIQRGIVHLHL